MAIHLEDQVTESFGGTLRVTEGEVDCVTAGGGIQNALSRLNIFEMKLGNYRFLIVTRELINRGIRANLKMYQKKAKLKSQVELAETITGHRDKCLPV